jgi:hypothetical protein
MTIGEVRVTLLGARDREERLYEHILQAAVIFNNTMGGKLTMDQVSPSFALKRQQALMEKKKQHDKGR